MIVVDVMIKVVDFYLCFHLRFHLDIIYVHCHVFSREYGRFLRRALGPDVKI